MHCFTVAFSRSTCSASICSLDIVSSSGSRYSEFQSGNGLLYMTCCICFVVSSSKLLDYVLCGCCAHVERFKVGLHHLLALTCEDGCHGFAQVFS